MRRKTKRVGYLVDRQRLWLRLRWRMTAGQWTYISDLLQHGHRFRTLNILDDYNREILGIDINSSIPASSVTRYLDQIATWRECPRKVGVDNGPAFVPSELATWAEKHTIQGDYIQPSKWLY